MQFIKTLTTKNVKEKYEQYILHTHTLKGTYLLVLTVRLTFQNVCFYNAMKTERFHMLAITRV